MTNERRRRVFVVFLLSLIPLFALIYQTNQTDITHTEQQIPIDANLEKATNALSKLEIKGRAPKTGYNRDQFGEGWAEIDGCDTRNIILARDLKDHIISSDGCKVISGKLDDPYTGKQILFARGIDTSADVQIDHVVALSDAWQKGAQYWDKAKRVQLANDSLELLAVDGPANQQKGDGDAATWLPSNKSYRCRYVARQIAIKQKYDLWITKAEHDSMNRILFNCPDQLLPFVK